MIKNFRATRRRVAPRARCIAALAVLVTGACAGPEAPLEVGSKNVPLELLLGAKRRVARAPLPPVSFDIGPDVPFLFDIEFVQAPPAPTRPPRPRVPKPTEECIDNPLAVPKDEAPPRLTPSQPPKKATYVYGVTGTFGGTAWPATATVEILNPLGPNPLSTPARVDSTWDVAVTLGGATTVTSYRARDIGTGADESRVPDAYPDENPFSSTPQVGNRWPQDRIPPDPTESVERPRPPGPVAGLYIDKVQRNGALAFQPSGGLLLAAFPLQVGEYYDVSGSDANTTMAYRTTVQQKAHVHVCGTAIDTWTVELTRGRITTLDTQEVVEFSARYQVAPQYGFLIVADHSELTSVAGAIKPVAKVIDTHITTPPK